MCTLLHNMDFLPLKLKLGKNKQKIKFNSEYNIIIYYHIKVYSNFKITSTGP